MASFYLVPKIKDLNTSFSPYGLKIELPYWQTTTLQNKLVNIIQFYPLKSSTQFIHTFEPFVANGPNFTSHSAKLKA